MIVCLGLFVVSVNFRETFKLEGYDELKINVDPSILDQFEKLTINKPRLLKSLILLLH